MAPLQIVKTIREMQDLAERYRCEGKKIAVVPTMGYLHRGHGSLISLARSRSDIVITTLFVNPTQFAPDEDFARYPRDFDHDKTVAGDAGTDILFFPEGEEMYPRNFNSIVEVEGTSKILAWISSAETSPESSASLRQIRSVLQPIGSQKK